MTHAAHRQDDSRDGVSNGRVPPAGVTAGCTLRRYDPRDEDAAIALWLRTWQTAYPAIDFAARLDWWRRRWRQELVPSAEIVVAQSAGAIVGFVTVEPRRRYLDQIVVAPQRWGTGVAALLIAEAKRLSPAGLDLDVNTDNARAIRAYEKHGFAISGAGVNPVSGRPVHRMSWRPPCCAPPPQEVLASDSAMAASKDRESTFR